MVMVMGLFVLIVMLLMCLFVLVEEQMGSPLIPFEKYSQSIGMKEVVGTNLGLWYRGGGRFFFFG